MVMKNFQKNDLQLKEPYHAQIETPTLSSGQVKETPNKIFDMTEHGQLK